MALSDEDRNEVEALIRRAMTEELIPSYLRPGALSHHIRTYVGSVAWTAGTGEQDVTDIPFQPRLIICFGTGFSDSASVGTFSMGAASADDERFSVGIRADATDGNRSAGGGLIKFHGSNSATGTDRADFVRFNSDGFTFDKTANANSPTMYYIAVG